MWESEDIAPTETEEERRARVQKKLQKMAEEQGVKPFDVDNLHTGFWPEDESEDEFIATIRAWRRGEEPPNGTGNGR